MSELTIARPGGPAGARSVFSPVTVALMLAVGVLGFIGTVVLGAYAPDLRSGRNGGAHALSNAATGYAGLVKLLEKTGRSPRVIRDEARFVQPELVVLTPERGATPIDGATGPRENKLTLMVLPKWSTAPDKERSGWVRVTGVLPFWEPEGVMAPRTRLTVRRRPGKGVTLRAAPGLPGEIRLAAPRPIQVITAFKPRVEKREDGSTYEVDRLEPLITDGRGGIVLGRFTDRPFFVLADPDLLSNHGVADLERARAAVVLLDHIAGGRADGIAFDVTLNGLGRGRSVLRLFFEPPLLAMTLAIAAALVLAGWQAFARFGAPATPERAVAFGKRALLDNTAALVRKARREAALGGRYADAIRVRARELFGVPAALEGTQADAYLDRINNGPRFSALASEVEAARDRAALLDAARRLHGWMGDRIR